MTEAAPRSLFLDLDGTLADSLPVMRAVYHSFLAEQGRRGDEEEFQSLNGPALPEIVATLRLRHALEGAPELLEARYRSLVADKYATAARPSHGAPELLAVAARRGIAVWVVTSAEREVAERFLKAHGLAGWLAGVVTAEGLARGKPDPAIYLHALEVAGVRANEVWAVEDSPNGVQAAIAAGLTTYALTQTVVEVPPERRISSLAELVHRLEECSVDTLSAATRVIASSESLAVTDETRRRIDALWQEELHAHPHRFDGTLLSFVRREGDVLHGRFIPYRYYMAQRREPTLPLAIVPLAVSGMLICQDQVAFARRSERATQYPGRIELVPSGGLDAECLRDDGTVDYRAQLVRELTEETGIPESEILSIEPVALLRDRVDAVLDLASIIEVGPRARAIAEIVIADGANEYRSLQWVAAAELLAFIESRREDLVPTSYALCEVLVRRRSAGSGVVPLS